MSFGPDGNLYIVDQGAYAIRRINNISANGTLDTSVHTIAGQLNTQSLGVADDSGGPASAATFFVPSDVKIDASGNIYVVDSYLAVIQVIYAAATPTSGTPAIPPILTVEGVTPQANYIYTVVGQFNNYCQTGGPCVSQGPALSLQLDASYLAIDAAGNIYFDDTYNNYIDVLYVGGTVPPILSAVVGNNVTAGNAYVIAGQPFNACSAAPCGDGGAALQALITTGPMYLDSHGDLYFADGANYALREIDAAGYISSQVGSANPVGHSSFYRPGRAGEPGDRWSEPFRCR